MKINKKKIAVKALQLRYQTVNFVLDDICMKFSTFIQSLRYRFTNKRQQVLTLVLVIKEPDGDTVWLPVHDHDLQTLPVRVPGQLLHPEGGSVGPDTGGRLVKSRLNS